jgi:flagellar assembly factor FliW
VETEILFEEGLIGVPRARRFELLARPGSPLRVLRCLDVPGFALPVVEPRLADPGYGVELTDRLVSLLEADGEEPMLLLAVATLEPDGPVANLRAPLVINVERRLGAQVILDDRSLPLRARVRVAS